MNTTNGRFSFSAIDTYFQIRGYNLKVVKKGIFLLSLLVIILSLVVGCGSTGGSSSSSDGSSGGGNTSDRSVVLSWDAPETNEDGSQLTDLAGYNAYYGQTSGQYTQKIDVQENRMVMIDSLGPGTWCFSVTAYDIYGNESNYSTELCTNLS